MEKNLLQKYKLNVIKVEKACCRIKKSNVAELNIIKVEKACCIIINQMLQKCKLNDENV